MKTFMIALIIIMIVCLVTVVFCVLNAAEYRNEWDEHPEIRGADHDRDREQGAVHR